jgi:hypothetical protein
MAWGLGRLYFGHRKPLILYGEFWNNIISAFVANMRIRPEELKVYRIVNSPEEVLAAIKLFEELVDQQPNPHESEKPFQLTKPQQ